MVKPALGQRFYRPWLLLPTQFAHDVSPLALRFISTFADTREDWRPFYWRGLNFPNPLGISGGVDKNAQLVKAWWALNAGFVEVGTITHLPQSANPGRIIDRDINAEAIWNKMGFPNHGAVKIKKRLMSLPKTRRTPIFINIGKNRTTQNAVAAKEYAALLREFSEYADVFVINISSPNTQGLRSLLEPKNLEPFLKDVLFQRPKNPCLLKVSPDISKAELETVLDVSLNCGIDGWILTNTSGEIRDGLRFPRDGGVSGRPLAARSEELLRHTVQHLGGKQGDRLIVSCGGVMSTRDVTRRLDIGANLVQVYTALVMHGPRFFIDVAREITGKR